MKNFNLKDFEVEPSFDSDHPLPFSSKHPYLTSITTRILFLTLLVANIVWIFWTLSKIVLLIAIFLLVVGQSFKVKKIIKRAFLSLKRSGVCLLSLVMALLSPSLGFMAFCTYFIMYDKEGIYEVIPKSLQDQFQGFLKESE